MKSLKYWTVFGLLLALSGEASFAATDAAKIPPAVQSALEEIESKFNSTLSQECNNQLCTSVGCQVVSFRTLDENQNSSLPGLDVSDEVGGELQYELSATRCEFAYEPTLSEAAVTTLRRRLGDKIRTAGMVLSIQGRKLSAPIANLKEGKAEEVAKGLEQTMPTLLLIIVATIALLTLIWAVRRLGKPKPIVVSPKTETVTDSSDESSSNAVTALSVLTKKEQLAAAFASNPEMASAALEPVVSKGDVEEICRILRHFGPEALASFSQKTQYRDLFQAVHQRYGEENFDESPTTLLKLFDKIERLMALAQLGRPQASLDSELGFLRDLAPDEFSQLLGGFENDELMAILSFVPAHMRTHYLQTRDAKFVESYVQHVLRHPRLSEQLLRRLSTRLQEQYSLRHAEIRKVSRDQLAQIEQLLNSVGAVQGRQMLADIRTENPGLFKRLISESILERAVVNIPEPILNDVFLSITPEEAAAYLQSHPDTKAILSKLKRPLAESIRSRFLNDGNSGINFLETSNPIADLARQKVNDVLRVKSTNGEINLRSLNESILGAHT